MTATVTRYFVILRDAGCIPEKKGSWRQRKRMVDFVREAIRVRPADTQITIVSLTWDSDLWVEDGREFIAVEDTLGGMARGAA